MDIVEELLTDHLKLRAAMSDLEAGRVTRESLASFVRDLLTHARLEDELLFESLEGSLPADHGPLAVMRAEHEEIEGRLARLEAADPERDDLTADLKRLVTVAREHFLKEEEVLFGFARRLLDADRLRALGAEIAERRTAALAAT
jgi:hemerythrin-like domain-containing protein